MPSTWLARSSTGTESVLPSSPDADTPILLGFSQCIFSAVFLFSGCFGSSCDYFSCGCGDRYGSVYDDDYPGYPDDYEGDYDPDNAYDSYYDGVWGESRDSEDEEEGYSDEDRSSQSSDEDEGIVKQEDDKTIVPVTDAPHPSAVMETKVDVKQETKEEVLNGPFIARFVDSKLEILAGAVPGAAPVGCAATENGTGEQASTSSGIGPDVQTEGKRVSGYRLPIALGSASLHLTRHTTDIAKSQSKTVLNLNLILHAVLLCRYNYMRFRSFPLRLEV